MSFEVPERYNASTLLDDNLAAGHGERVAIRTEQEEVTYADLHDRVCRAARALQALGLQPEQRVLMVMDDTPAWTAVFLGAIRAGAVPVPVSYLDSGANFRHFIRDSGARIVVAEAPAYEKVLEALAALDRAPAVVVRRS